MASKTQEKLAQLVQFVGIRKAVKILGVKGVGPATYQKMLSGESKPSRQVVGRASRAADEAKEQAKLQESREVAKRIYGKNLKRQNIKVPTTKSSPKEIKQFNEKFYRRSVTPSRFHKVTGKSQKFLARSEKSYFIQKGTLRFEGQSIVGTNAYGEDMYLVYLLVPKKIGNRTVLEKEWYFATQEHIDRYNKFKQGEIEALYNVWEYEGVEFHVYSARSLAA